MDIKDCPLCDGKCYLIEHGVSTTQCFIECRECGLNTSYSNNHIELIKFWNTRANNKIINESEPVAE